MVVIDSAKALQVFADDQSLRVAYYELASRVAHTGAVVLLVGEYTPEEIESRVEFALADGIVQVAYESYEPVDRRWLRVVKMRGANHLAGKHSFRISDGGLRGVPPARDDRVRRTARRTAASVSPAASRGSTS